MLVRCCLPWPLSFREDRGFRLFRGMKLPAPGSWPTGGVWLYCLLGDAFLFALLCFDGSEGLCGALFGVPDLRTRGRGRFQPDGETREGSPASGIWRLVSLRLYQRARYCHRRVSRSSPLLLPLLPGLYEPLLPTSLLSAS